MIQFLLKNGCNPNEAMETIAPGYRSISVITTPFSIYLGLIGLKNGTCQLSTHDHGCSSRLHILRDLLSHGANADDGASTKRLPKWVYLFQNMCQDDPESLSTYYLEIVEALLSFGADPNRLCGSYTPWTQLLAWLLEYHSSWKRSLRHQEFLTRLITVMLGHGADPAAKVYFEEMGGKESGYKTRTQREQVIRVQELTQTYFCPQMAGRILDAIPVGMANDDTELAPPPEVPEAKRNQQSLWNPMSWIPLFRLW